MKYLAFLLLGLIICACNVSERKVILTSNGIIIHVPEGLPGKQNWMEIEVKSDEIIHFSVSPDSLSLRKKSLIIEAQEQEKVDFNFNDDKTRFFIETSKLKVSINKENLNIKIFDKKNNLLLEETTLLTHTTDTSFVIAKAFCAEDTENFYGLGQHQNGLIGYKGHEIDLWQNNTVAVVPFLTSSKGYGILWDNYSRTKFTPGIATYSFADSIFMNSEANDHTLHMKARSNTGEMHERPIKLPFQNLEDTVCDFICKIKVPASGWYNVKATYMGGFLKMEIDNEKVLENNLWEYVKETSDGLIYLEKNEEHDMIVRTKGLTSLIDISFILTKDDYVSVISDAGTSIDYYFVYGPSMDDVISGYRKLTGKSGILPKWAFGFWQSRERYQSQDEIIDVIEGFRKRKIPLDVIVQDWKYWPEFTWGSHQFDKKRYPNPQKMIADIHKLNVKFSISVWPMYTKGIDNYNDFKSQDFLLKWEEPSFVGGPPFVFYDVYNPAARKEFWNKVNNSLFKIGVDNWWLDATEPNTAYLDPDTTAKFLDSNYFGSGKEYLTAYSLFHAKAFYEGQRNETDDKRVCILTRSAFAGQQKYNAIVWSGDLVADWEIYKKQISAGLNMCLSGVPYWSCDIGGFIVHYPDPLNNDEWRELYTRWFQFGTFCPVFRSHGSSTPREMWYFGEKGSPYYDTQLNFDKLRYNLMPYIYSLSGMVWRDDYTMMRALCMDFPHDTEALKLTDQYMFGSALLVCPVVEKNVKQRKVYLPDNNTWFDFWTGEKINGGVTIDADAPLEKMPLFVKAGSILPMSSDIQYAMEKSDKIEIRVYQGANGEFVLYQDENDNYNYEKGQYSIIKFTWDDEAKLLTIHPREGSFQRMRENIVFSVTLVDKGKGISRNVFAMPDKVVNYTGEKITFEF